MKELQDIFKSLTSRQQEVITRRFGLGKTEPETLAEIGARFGITRERVRQIESTAIKPLGDAIRIHPVCNKLIQSINSFLVDNGGVVPADRFLSYCADQNAGVGEPDVALLAEATQNFSFSAEDSNFNSFYYLNKESFRLAKSFIDAWVKIISGKKSVVLAGHYSRELQSFIEEKKMFVAHAENYLAISKKIHHSPYGDVGLAEWPEIKPQTIRDRIYLVLSKEGKPAHFRTIADRITAANFDTKAALAATVHNELIKDPRFVLVGRGMYALKEYGYESGTARDVIKKILAQEGALYPKDVILAAQKKWFFKENTILVNLQNRSHFERRSDGRYQVREA
ncbi:MAG: hypothetical protein NUV53_03675 [Patescibacteria group bacterium]|nr:hypothetical protein [Patescibacteria group bacterium]